MEVSNKDGTVCGEIDEGQEFYEEVSSIVREKGVMGSKGTTIYDAREGVSAVPAFSSHHAERFVGLFLGSSPLPCLRSS